jgi:hemerythrin
MHADARPGLTTGIDEIDRQHLDFLRHLAALREALTRGIGGRDSLMKTLRYLDEFVSVHFETEEKYMRLYHYPGILLHQREHAQFARTYSEIKQRVLDLDARGEITSFITLEIAHRLENWLTGHILVVDKRMGEFLAERM